MVLMISRKNAAGGQVEGRRTERREVPVVACECFVLKKSLKVMADLPETSLFLICI